ncbi:uncharacterized protein MYCFIDRAFT_213875 [Pseudocercospora fijiensis CIRAD86]|uniref:J domain-containing protein n=1 Tax=Pseudocercospora fijiensis (strain CIRAD86) TaxID=383855 RepID=M2Z6Q6_PSEFD|nr:uncharacterized protein MYCFIDRAFT_213875 [Pseudocercospora fijiensis CIRAD86]EME85460.1 hypothetical protein MYCFIDRAFT_213875 [Pseudocercospora fijiensis CIRAD86]
MADLKEEALNSSHDFYDLLGIAPSSQESEIRRAYRKTALKYHPDKVGDDQAALDKFHLLSIAYEVLSDQDVRQLYDNARRAREEKKERDAAYEGRRRALKEELERRESAGVAGFKRKREEAQEEEAFQRELKRLAADGARRRKEREEMLRREAEDEQNREQREDAEKAEVSDTPATPAPVNEDSVPSEMHRTCKLRWLPSTSITTSDLESRFQRFGKIQDVVISPKPKKIKVDGEKHRKEYMTALIIFENIVAASMAVREGSRLVKEDTDRADWGVFEGIDWASGKEPEGLPKPPASNGSSTSKEKAAYNRWLFTKGLEKTALTLKGKPSFGSFKKKPE